MGFNLAFKGLMSFNMCQAKIYTSVYMTEILQNPTNSWQD